MGKNKTEAALEQLKQAMMDHRDNPHLEDDFFLLKFLKSSSMDLKKAEKNLRQSLQWRKEHDLDSLATKDYHEGLLQHFPIHYGKLRRGGVVAMLHMSKIDAKSLIEKYGKDEVFKYMLQHAAKQEVKNLEWSRELFQRSGSAELTENCVMGDAAFIDFRDVSLGRLMSVQVLSLYVQFVGDYMKYFPIIDSLCIGVNCVKFLLPFVNIMRKIIETPNCKVEIYDTNQVKWTKAILEHADVDQITPFVGGRTMALTTAMKKLTI